jgi:transcriptional regulator with XRE-family HTH domain
MQMNETIKAWRKAAGLTLEQLAEASHVDRSSLNRIELGLDHPKGRKFDETHLRKLAKFYGVQPWQLLAYDPAERHSFDELWAQLNPSERAEAEDFLRYLLSKRRTVHSQEGAADLVDLSGGRR